MTDGNVPNVRVSTRCSACKLEAELLTELHRDRFENGLGYEALAMKYRQPHLPLSEAGCRRHFTRHVSVPPESAICEPDADQPHGDHASNAQCDGYAVLENGTRILAGLVESLAEEYRTAGQHGPQGVERAFSKYIKAQSELAKCVKQLETSRMLKDKLRQTIPHIAECFTESAIRSMLTVVREHAQRVRDDAVEYSHGRLTPQEMHSRLLRYEFEWANDHGAKLRQAQRDAVKAGEAKLEGRNEK